MPSTPGKYDMVRKSGLYESILTFALDLYKQVKNTEENVFFSPLSIAAALCMTLAGARGKTAKEISTALHLNEDTPIHEAFSELQKSIRRCGPRIALHVANRIYSERTVPPLPEFCSLLEECYVTTVEPVDFRNDAETARQQINKWVECVTEDKIKDLLAEGTVDADCVMILVNAVYFKGLWNDPFEKSLTRLMDFHETSSVTKKVEMMYHDGTFRTGHSSQLKANVLELPYHGYKASMVILLPEYIEGLKFLEEHVTHQNLSSALRDTGSCDVKLYLPRFKVEYEMRLVEVLRNLGIKDLFTLTADLTGITEEKGVKFSDAVHKAFVDVNEEGTEAAAATSMVMTDCAMPQKIFKADHPFMFFIMTRDPRVVLFVGSLKHP